MGDLNPSDESLVFYKYRGEKERWVSHKWLKQQRLRAAKSNRAHYKKNKEYYVDKTQRKRKRTTNINLSDFNKEKIKKIYASAEDDHVDHIFPLIHPHFCGLHVPWNLQVLTAFDNLSKGNKVETSYFSMLGEHTLRFEEKRV
jgi:5-methylcytosine-specific restriction endonuclease McrA